MPETAAQPEAQPWLKYRSAGNSAAAPAEGPWSRYKTAEAPTLGLDGEAAGAPAPGLLERVWSGLSGKDASKAGRFGMGAGDMFYGGAQIGARMEQMPGGGVPEAAGLYQPPPDKTAVVDKTVRDREQSYEAGRHKTEGPGSLGMDWMRLLGNVAGQAPVMAAGGALASAPASVAGRVAGSAALGAASGVMNPTTEKNFGAAKLVQGAEGLAGGAVGGAAGEAVGSWLGRAIAGNSPQAIDQAITSKFRSVVKPSRIGQGSEQTMGMQDRRILTAVDQIIQNRRNLQLTDEAGNPMRGALPRSLRQFSEAIDQTKRDLFKAYGGMPQAAESQGVRVDLAPAIQHLRDVAKKPEIADFHPNLAVEAEQLASNFEKRGFYTPTEAQDIIQNLNETLKGFYKNPTNETVSRGSLLGPVVRALREGLDSAIEGAQGPGYQALRNQYGALRSIEKDVATSVQREANKLTGGVGGMFADIAASEEALRGIITLNPGALARAGGIKAAQAWMKHVNSPNRAISRLFERASNRNMPPPGMLRQGAAALSGGAGPAGALLGAQGMVGAMPQQRQPLEYPWMPAAR